MHQETQIEKRFFIKTMHDKVQKEMRKMNRPYLIGRTHSFAFPFSGAKYEEFVKKSDRDQIVLRARKFASSSWPCSVLIDSG
ncbi:hypothetical protein GCM10007906_13370 [Vibrio hyugaensis]|uniref:Uncharacterized protein n=1 Tax=Vibrio hyugaensis TaxID=1534743 RepID=A0ABQ5Y3R9_9VIBR|nr:hypothetical protein GCM10007906_13370 [Vibrio hyugaensis]